MWESKLRCSSISTHTWPSVIIFAENDFPYLIQDLDELVFLQKKLKVNQSVVIGGIKINTEASTKNSTPGLSKVPVVGNLFKSKTNKNVLSEMLIFLAPRVID